MDVLDLLRSTPITDYQRILLADLEVKLLRDLLWPSDVMAAAVEVFGAAVYNPKGKTHKALDLCIRHAIRVWRSRYGLNAAQHMYAEVVMAHSIRASARKAPAVKNRYGYVQAGLRRLVNDEKVHDGMARRASGGEVRQFEEHYGTAA
ncbi:MAG: hypothetical protein H0U53_10935 [Actinobacteria bacterium]|nr:hypothetical protein [Actinomycetota bacterium]